jgi:DNA-binding CsgD family transcriptional regulator
MAAHVSTRGGDADLRERVLSAVNLLERECLALFAAVAQHARGILESDVEMLLTAARLSDSSPRPLLRAFAFEDAGDELARTHRDAEAREHLSVAFDAYVQCGAVADARRLRHHLRDLGVVRRAVHRRATTGWGSLTNAERQVVRLVVDGATNRAVAEQLHLSPHTVNTHLRNAYAKLGVHSRHELTVLTNSLGDAASRTPDRDLFLRR